MATTETFKNCEECGATIYVEHIERHTADRWQGKLLCPHCLREKKEASMGGSGAGEAAIHLVEDVVPVAKTAGPPRTERSISEPPVAAPRQYKRALDPASAHATRCRTFHCKLSDASIVHLNEQINDWADSQSDVCIKFATTTVGVVEGKHNDPHLIVTVFY